MSTNWRIGSFNGALLAVYFIPSWTLLAFRIMVSPIHSFYERPNVAVAFFASDYLHLGATGMVRAAWLLALGRFTVVAFFAMFALLMSRPSIRKSGGYDEALAVALGIGSVISFAMMLMASQVGELDAMRMHATELLMLLGAAIVLLIEHPPVPRAAKSEEPLVLQESQLLNNP